MEIEFKHKGTLLIEETLRHLVGHIKALEKLFPGFVKRLIEKL